MDWWQLAIAVATGNGLTAIVNAIANRRGVTADVYESISRSAATLAKNMAQAEQIVFLVVDAAEKPRFGQMFLVDGQVAQNFGAVVAVQAEEKNMLRIMGRSVTVRRSVQKVSIRHGRSCHPQIQNAVGSETTNPY